MSGTVTDYVRTTIDRAQARSVVMNARGVVATEHPMASQAGAWALARGGHAVDAAIAANAVMGVVAPMMNGVGGDLFAMVRDGATGSVHGLNASGWSPAGLSIDRLRAQGIGTMPQAGALAVTVPGAVAGWAALGARFGRQPLADLLAPAVALADDGFPVPEITAGEWAGSVDLLLADDEAARTYLPGGRPPRTGSVFRNPSLASTYRTLAAEGADALYRGSLSGRIVECVARHGGVLEEADLRAYEAEWVAPLSTRYRDWRVYELPPNGQGIAALMMLNLLEVSPMGSYGHNSVEALHTLIEAKKLAYSDMKRWACDPAFHEIPVASLLSKAYAAERGRLIDPARASAATTPGELPRGSDTTYLAVVDREGNMVSLIQSNFANFGSGLVPEGAGFALQSRGGMFTLDPSHPNALAPRKRPLHTIIPGFMEDERQAVAFGIMGGWNQAQAHAQFVSNVVDYGMNIQAALEAARVTKLTFDGTDVTVESRVPEGTRAGLAARGHDVHLQGPYSSLVGGGQAVARDLATGVNHGASDPRKDGAAIPELFIPS